MRVSNWTTRVLQTPDVNPLIVGVDQPDPRAGTGKRPIRTELTNDR